MEFIIEDYIKNFFKFETDKDLKDNWEKTFDQMAVHTRKMKPKELLETARPNEEPKITKYRIDNYRPITYGVVNKSIDDVYRAVGGVNYSIENMDSKTKDYIENNNFDSSNFEIFMQKKVLRRDIEDPNGFLLWLPDGEGILEANKSVSPQPLLMYSSQMHFTDWKNVASFLSCEYSIIDTGDKIIHGKIYYILTKDKFYKLVQIGIDDKEDYRLDEIYTHNIGELPFIILGGDINNDNYFNSFFSGFLAFGDECIRQFSDWQAIMVTCGFPIKEQFMNDCEIKILNKQSNPIPEDEEKFEEVTKTRSENTMHETPLGKIIRKVPTQGGFDEVLDVTIPSIRFIAPPIEVAQEAKKSWQELRLLAQEDLNQSLSYAGDSGKKVELTNEGKYSMLTKIYNNYYDIFKKSLIYIEAYLTLKTADKIKISINKPESITLNSTQDILNDVSALNEGNAPYMLRAERTKDLSKKMFSGNPVAQKIFDVITVIDPLFAYNSSEKTEMQLANNISPEAVAISINAYGVLSEIAMRKTPNWFINASIEDIQKEFDKEIKKYLPAGLEEMKDDNGNVIDPLGGG